jgi:hypothetical protein
MHENLAREPGQSAIPLARAMLNKVHLPKQGLGSVSQPRGWRLKKMGAGVKGFSPAPSVLEKSDAVLSPQFGHVPETPQFGSKKEPAAYPYTAGIYFLLLPHPLLSGGC